MRPVADLRLDDLASSQAAGTLRSARETAPVAWVPELDGWLVTGRAAAIQVLRDATTFTVDDERFSTAVVVGTSMLSTDGDEHARHRQPFAAPFTGPTVARQIVPTLIAQTERRVADLAARGHGELRTELAGPLAVGAIIEVLGLVDVDEAEVLSWYRSIVAGVDRVSAGLGIEASTAHGLASLRAAVEHAATETASMVASAATTLTSDELFANVAVLMFGAIETSEGMIATAFWHLLTVPALADAMRHEPARVSDLVEESLRLEPAAAVVDRYATSDISIGGAAISQGDFVRVSLSAANRDPAVFDAPDAFDLTRANARQHLAFVQGPHVCLGLHVARAQTVAAVHAVLRQLPGLELVDAEAPTGLIFRKPARLPARWNPNQP